MRVFFPKGQEKLLIDLTGHVGRGVKFRVITPGVTLFVSNDFRILQNKDGAGNPKDGMPYQSTDSVETFSSFSDQLWGLCAVQCEAEVWDYANGHALSPRTKISLPRVGTRVE